jgi:hypothetical protein
MKQTLAETNDVNELLNDTKLGGGDQNKLGEGETY